MRRLVVVAFVVSMLTSCSSRSVREPWWRDWPDMDWNIQRHIFETEEAWEQGTGRRFEHDHRSN
jgi:hypothetical protein